MKTVREFCLGRTIIVIGAMFVWAWASQQAHSQNLDCNNGCGTYAEYALAQRLHLPESIQNLPTDKPTLNGLALLWQIKSLERILRDRWLGDLRSRRHGGLEWGSGAVACAVPWRGSGTRRAGGCVRSMWQG